MKLNIISFNYKYLYTYKPKIATMFKKRAQGLSINVIIIAVIGLVILVVVIAVFTGRLGIFGEGLSKASEGFEKTCEEIGGASPDGRTDGCRDTENKIISKDALPGSGKNCCRCKTWDGATGSCA